MSNGKALIIQADNTILLDLHHENAEAVQKKLDQIADLELESEHSPVYRINRRTLFRGHSLGLPKETLLQQLTENSSTPVHQSLEFEINDIFTKPYAATIKIEGETIQIEYHDESVQDSIQTHFNKASVAINNNTFILRPTKLDKVREKFLDDNIPFRDELQGARFITSDMFNRRYNISLNMIELVEGLRFLKDKPTTYIYDEDLDEKAAQFESDVKTWYEQYKKILPVEFQLPIENRFIDSDNPAKYHYSPNLFYATKLLYCLANKDLEAKTKEAESPLNYIAQVTQFNSIEILMVARMWGYPYYSLRGAQIKYGLPTNILREIKGVKTKKILSTTSICCDEETDAAIAEYEKDIKTALPKYKRFIHPEFLPFLTDRFVYGDRDQRSINGIYNALKILDIARFNRMDQYLQNAQGEDILQWVRENVSHLNLKVWTHLLNEKGIEYEKK